MASAHGKNVIYIIQAEHKWACSENAALQEKLGSCWPRGTVVLCRGVRGAGSLKLHLWQQSNKWLCLRAGTTLPPCGHSSFAFIGLHRSCPPSIILPASPLDSFAYCLREKISWRLSHCLKKEKVFIEVYHCMISFHTSSTKVGSFC